MQSRVPILIVKVDEVDEESGRARREELPEQTLVRS